jgi:hypothetical protein
MPAPPGVLSGSEMLDQPPPSPALGAGMNPGNPGIPGMSQLMPNAGAGLSAQSLPPDVLTGMMQAADKISQDLDAFAQMTPDLAQDWAAVKETLAVAMSKVLLAGSGPTSPTAAGPGFPGGGLERGAVPLASGGTSV